jgi:hypothetical protein
MRVFPVSSDIQDLGVSRYVHETLNHLPHIYRVAYYPHSFIHSFTRAFFSFPILYLTVDLTTHAFFFLLRMDLMMYKYMKETNGY